MEKIVISSLIILLLVAGVLSYLFYFKELIDKRNLEKFETANYVIYYPKGFKANTNNESSQEKGAVFAKENPLSVVFFRIEEEDTSDLENAKSDKACEELVSAARGVDGEDTAFISVKYVNANGVSGCEEIYTTKNEQGTLKSPKFHW